MRRSKFNESQIVGILKEAEAGVSIPDLLRRHGISKTTFFKWRSKYAGACLTFASRHAVGQKQGFLTRRGDMRQPLKSVGSALLRGGTKRGTARKLCPKVCVQVIEKIGSSGPPLRRTGLATSILVPPVLGGADLEDAAAKY